MANDLPLVVVEEVVLQEVEASLQELGEWTVGCCLVVEEGVQKTLIEAQVRSLQVVEGEVHAFLVEHQEVKVQKIRLAGVLQEVMVDLLETGCSGLVVVCWVQGVEEVLESLVWDWVDPLEDQGHCHGHQQGFLGA